MKKLLLSAVILLTACSSVTSQNEQATNQAKEFYTSYLNAFGSNVSKPYPSDELRKYVSANTINRINAIQDIPGQDLIEADYFTYVQDYSNDWVPQLRVEGAKPFLGGEVVQVMEGIGNGGYIHLEAFLRREDGVWKIYRVRDVTNNHEHPIFNSGAFAQAKALAESGK